MKVKDYLKQLQEYTEEYPEVLEMEAVYPNFGDEEMLTYINTNNSFPLETEIKRVNKKTAVVKRANFNECTGSMKPNALVI